MLIADILWGFSFTVQSLGLDKCPPLMFNGIRMVIGGLVLFPVMAFADSKNKKLGKTVVSWTDKKLLKGSLICGICLCAASNLQNFGLKYTTPGKSGFLTALYVLFVPLVYFILFRYKTEKKIWFCVAISLVGMYFLCLTGSSSINIGDVLTFLCAIAYSFHIISIDRNAPGTDSIKISSYQFLFTGIVSIILSLIFEDSSLSSIGAAIIPILYSGILSTGVAFTFQVLAIPMLNPVVASILSSFESVFALVGGMIILHDIPTIKEGFGCILMFSALIIAQVPGRKKQ